MERIKREFKPQQLSLYILYRYFETKNKFFNQSNGTVSEVVAIKDVNEPIAILTKFPVYVAKHTHI